MSDYLCGTGAELNGTMHPGVEGLQSGAGQDFLALRKMSGSEAWKDRKERCEDSGGLMVRAKRSWCKKIKKNGGKIAENEFWRI